MTNDKPSQLMKYVGPAVTVGVILLIIALLVPAVYCSREAARRSQSKNNLKQIGLALHNYHDTFQVLPPGGVFNAERKAFHGWMTFITPYLDASPWYNQVNFNIPWDDPRQIERFQPGYGSVFSNPSVSSNWTRDGLRQTHYAGSDLLFYRNSSTGIRNLTNGTSNTFFMGDAKGDFEPFGSTYNWRSCDLGLNKADACFGCAVRDVTMMLIADGAVRDFSHETDEALFTSLRGVNSKWDEAPADVSKPALPSRVSPPKR